VTSAIFLAGKGILPEVEVLALKRVVSLQLQQILEQEQVTKTELASRMKTSRTSLDRMLDPSNSSLAVASHTRRGHGTGKISLIILTNLAKFPPSCKSPSMRRKRNFHG
jgi:antitoxin HicB